MHTQDAQLVPDGECGIASVHLVAAYFGLDVPSALIEPLRADGSTLGEVASAFEALGFSADFQVVSIDHLGRTAEAAVLWLPARDSRPGHLWVKLGAERGASLDVQYVILDASTPGGVSVHDPRDLAAAGWEGGAILLQRHSLASLGSSWQVVFATLVLVGLACAFVGRMWARRMVLQALTTTRVSSPSCR